MASLTLADIAARTVPRQEPTVAKSKHWMATAFVNSHGQFKAKAAKAGKSTAQFAAHALAAGSHASTKTKRQAALAERGIEASHSRHKRWYGSKED
jgi:hypothetical protein